jgi:hypothetical protein
MTSNKKKDASEPVTKVRAPTKLKKNQPFRTEHYTYVRDMQCDAQNAKYHTYTAALMQLPFKFQSSAYQYGHLIPVPDG